MWSPYGVVVGESVRPMVHTPGTCPGVALQTLDWVFVGATLCGRPMGVMVGESMRPAVQPGTCAGVPLQ